MDMEVEENMEDLMVGYNCDTTTEQTSGENPDADQYFIAAVLLFLKYPLHAAIRNGYRFDIIRRIILDHTVNINQVDSEGRTAFFVACTKCYINMHIVEELLFNGADITIYNRRSYTRQLNKALKNIDFVKLVIKITLLVNFKGTFMKTADLIPYILLTEHNNMYQYFQNCVKELESMTREFAFHTTSVYDFIRMKCADIVLSLNQMLLLYAISKKFPIYSYMILGKVMCKLTKLHRSTILRVLDHSHIYTMIRKNETLSKCTLNRDCVYEITQYLDDDSLLNVLIAFYDINLSVK